MLFNQQHPVAVCGAFVMFEPAIRTARHDASQTMSMTHIALQEADHGQVVTWLEHIRDEQYRSIE